MEKIMVKGGNILKGSVDISGAKNAALPIIAASLLTEEKVILENVPQMDDVRKMCGILRSIGAELSFENNRLEITPGALNISSLSHSDLAAQIRYSSNVLSALVPRFGEVKMPLPGGCKIGARPLDFLFSSLASLGAKTKVDGSTINVTREKLFGSHIVLNFPSVSTTENIMVVASLAKGTSVIENAAKEPEIVDLANFLCSMGARISGAGTSTIKITGVTRLNGTRYSIIPDRIETGTYLAATIITGGDTLLRKTNLALLRRVVSTLRRIGAEIEETPEGVRVTAKDTLRPTSITTRVYPGFPTDMQPIMTSLLAVAEGQSSVTETIYDNRFNHVSELLKMNADIKIKNDTLYISGRKKLSGAVVDAHDIRCGASLIVAALNADGITTIENSQQILRGYEKPTEKLQGLGAECSMLLE